MAQIRCQENTLGVPKQKPTTTVATSRSAISKRYKENQVPSTTLASREKIGDSTQHLQVVEAYVAPFSQPYKTPPSFQLKDQRTSFLRNNTHRNSNTQEDTKRTLHGTFPDDDGNVRSNSNTSYRAARKLQLPTGAKYQCANCSTSLFEQSETIANQHRTAYSKAEFSNAMFNQLMEQGSHCKCIFLKAEAAFLVSSGITTQQSGSIACPSCSTVLGCFNKAQSTCTCGMQLNPCSLV